MGKDRSWWAEYRLSLGPWEHRPWQEMPKQVLGTSIPSAGQAGYTELPPLQGSTVTKQAGQALGQFQETQVKLEGEATHPSGQGRWGLGLQGVEEARRGPGSAPRAQTSQGAGQQTPG